MLSKKKISDNFESPYFVVHILRINVVMDQ